MTTKMECCTPDRITHMDLEVRWDSHGPHTGHYDKRVDMAEQGNIGKVRRCPHISSLLAYGCKYGTLVESIDKILYDILCQLSVLT